MLTELKKNLLNDGVVIPAHPLALTEERKLDEETQAGLTRYYINAGAGGVAVGHAHRLRPVRKRHCF